MTDLVPSEDIERLVGVKRHASAHCGRVLFDQGRFVILHSRECLNTMADLRECAYSTALDVAIACGETFEQWPVEPVVLDLSHADLIYVCRVEESDD